MTYITFPTNNFWDPMMPLLACFMGDLCSLLRLGMSPERSMDNLWIQYDALEEMVRAIDEINWFETEYARLPSDYETLYGNLRLIEPLDARRLLLTRRNKQLLRRCDKLLTNDRYDPYDLPQYYPLLHQLDRGLAHLKSNIDNYRLCVRTCIDELGRGTVQPLNILDLPNELLILIFNFLRCHDRLDGYRHYNSPIYVRPSSDIQNTRLTCRRFCAASSHLLINYIHVECQTKSLGRLLEISKHPTISKGVFGVVVKLTSYHPVLANDRRAFARVWAQRLRNKLDDLCESDDPTPSNEDLENWHKVEQAWENVASNGSGSLHSEPCTKAIRTCHMEFKKRVLDQECLGKGGIFVRLTAMAMSQMPLAQDLAFYEPIEFDGESPLLASNDPLAIGRSLLYPFSSKEHEAHHWNHHLPFGNIPDFLAALPPAGVSIKTLKIESGVWSANLNEATVLVFNPMSHDNIRLLASNLKYVSCQLHSLYGETLDQLISDNSRFLSVVLDTDSLTGIDIHVADTRDFTKSSACSIGPILNSRKRDQLNMLRLSEVAIHENELQQIISSLQPKSNNPYSGVQILLSYVQLLSGSWASVLDSLHDKVDYRSILRHPYGGECEDMTDDEYWRIFSGGGRRSSLAEKYIRNVPRGISNPMHITSPDLAEPEVS
ncbi:hypothetical protein F5B22DRAFT_383194 [Xylaria bambusicola]|uniref:uncharacterized protein n=1 Tax=Xylaria bambusicola TaxID=326684 RepID=UPI002007B4F2|nr:uncharacterized protein F5B22DRAFT_383194 [Xylaria bambusicola]KAI0508767.1 hypothetical protein F5B22DRAFT_383194 [Xylaria bambusicola]